MGSKILISGAGIAGPALAYWLLRHGFEPMIVERAAAFRDGGYLVDFWGIGFDVAERMGLLPALRARASDNDRFVIVRRDGSVRSSFGGQAVRRALDGRFFSIPRGELAETVYQTVSSRIETRFGDEIAGLAQSSEAVSITFKSGERRRFELVIGADGLHSAIRSLAFPDAAASNRDLGYRVAAFSTAGYSRRDEGTYLSYAAPGRQASRFALRNDRTGFLFVFAGEQNSQPNPDVEWQKAMIRNAFAGDGWIEWPEIQTHLAAADDLYFDEVAQIQMPRWSDGRVALVGDAAYCLSLLAGEGSGFAMAGAYILAGELHRHGGDHASAFAAYEERFRPFTLSKQKSARAFAASFTPRSSFGLFVRDAVLWLAGIPFVANLLMSRFVTDDFSLPEYDNRRSFTSPP